METIENLTTLNKELEEGEEKAKMITVPKLDADGNGIIDFEEILNFIKGIIKFIIACISVVTGVLAAIQGGLSVMGISESDPIIITACIIMAILFLFFYVVIAKMEKAMIKTTQVMNQRAIAQETKYKVKIHELQTDLKNTTEELNAKKIVSGILTFAAEKNIPITKTEIDEI